MDINRQLSNLRQNLFKQELINAVGDFKKYLNSQINLLIQSYEFEAMRIIPEDKKLIAKIKILEKLILQIYHPYQKTMAMSLLEDYKKEAKL